MWSLDLEEGEVLVFSPFLYTCVYSVYCICMYVCIYIHIHLCIYGFLPKCLFPKMIVSYVLMGARCLFYSFAISGSYWMEHNEKTYDVVKSEKVASARTLLAAT